jgi:hypothetical protein
MGVLERLGVEIDDLKQVMPRTNRHFLPGHVCTSLGICLSFAF